MFHPCLPLARYIAFRKITTITFAFYNSFFICIVVIEYVNIEYPIHIILYHKLHHFSGEKSFVPATVLLLYPECPTNCRFIG